MQQTGKRKTASRLKRTNSVVNPPSLSSFSLVHRFGKVEIVKVTVLPADEKQQYFSIPDFFGWSMPPIPVGYIKCRNFDFL
jgi:hypothetical protein